MLGEKKLFFLPHYKLSTFRNWGDSEKKGMKM
jgi:hypothetical protein